MNKSSAQISHLIDLSLGRMVKAIEKILSIIAFLNLQDPMKKIEDDLSSDRANRPDPQGCLKFLMPAQLLRLLFGRTPYIEKADPSPRFKLSLAHPKLLSKRFASPFLIHIYLPEGRKEVDQSLRRDFHDQESTEHMYDSELTIGRTVQIKLWSPEITFSDPIKKRLASAVNKVSFLGKPSDDCQPGIHWATLVICDAETSNEIQSINYSVQIVDYAFDHVSRPLLSNVMSFTLGAGSLTMYLLTLLGQIDTTYGLASGTAAGAMATFIHVRFLNLYQRLNMNHNP